MQGVTWQRVLVGQSREGPALFKYHGKYYLISSGATGWSPNPASYAMADHIFGPWTVKGNPCMATGAETTLQIAKHLRLADSRCVWLPFGIRPDGSFSLRWREEWNLADFLRVAQ